MVFCSCSLVSNQIYHPKTSFPIKFTIESMVYYSHLPKMVRARWLWRISRKPIRNGEIFWINNDWAAIFYSINLFIFFPSRAFKQFIHLICFCKQFFQDFFKPPVQKVDGPFLSRTLALRLNWSRASAQLQLSLARQKHDIWTERQLKKFSRTNSHRREPPLHRCFLCGLLNWEQ